MHLPPSGVLFDKLIDQCQSLFQPVSVGQCDPEGMGNKEAVAVADQYPLLIQQTVAEYLCIHIDVIVYQVSGAVRIGVLLKMRVTIQPAVDDFFVGVNDRTAG